MTCKEALQTLSLLRGCKVRFPWLDRDLRGGGGGGGWEDTEELGRERERSSFIHEQTPTRTLALKQG